MDNTFPRVMNSSIPLSHSIAHERMNTKYNIYEISYIILFLFLFPQSILSQVIDGFEYGDEVFGIIGLVTFINHYTRKRILEKYPKVMKMFYLAFSVAIIGWIGTFLHGIQKNFIVNLTDCFTILKFYFIFYLSLYLLNKSKINNIINPIFKITKLYIIFGSIFFIISQGVDIGMTPEVRFGIRTFKFINSNVGDYSSILIISLVIFHIVSYYKRKPLRILKGLTIILIIFTFRGKALGFMATYLMAVFLIDHFQKKKKKALIIIAILGICGGYFQIRYYFLDNVTPRALFLANGIETANQYFPTGAGFSTYGSNMAKVHYSPLYRQYGFSKIWGMNEDEQQFLNDNFWPMIMGQYGWIGMLLYIAILVLMFKIVNKQLYNKQLKIAGFSIFFLLLYSSVGGPIFVHYIGCASIIIFSLILKVNGDIPHIINEKRCIKSV